MKNYTATALLVAIACLLGLTEFSRSGLQGEEKAARERVFELRTYVTHEGKLPDLNKRFRDHTMRLFEKHGMKNVVYLMPEKTENTLVYLISHESREAADASWAAFQKDPEWHKVRDESEKNGKILVKVERQYLQPTDYSPMK